MNVLVTGATGFIGRHVVRSLLKRKHSVTAIVRKVDSASEIEWLDSVRLVVCDIHQPDLCVEKLKGLGDVVMHLAWRGLPNYKSLFHIEENLPAQCRFLKNLVLSGYKHLLVTGTCLEYGMQSGCLDKCAETRPSIPYSIAKDTLRKYLQALQAEHPYTLQWARLFYLYGQGQNPNSVISQLDRAIDRGDESFNMSGGEQLRDYLPVTDAADELVKLAENPQFEGPIDVCSGKPISIRRLVEQRIAEKAARIQLNLGYYPYPDYEPMAFWGNRSCLDSIRGKSKLIREIFRVDGVPVFQNKMFDSSDAAKKCPLGDIVLVRDLRTGLIYNRAYNEALVKYDSDYQNEQACSNVFQNHIQSVIEIIGRYYKEKSLLEIGCGKGFFLRLLQEKGFTITGVDPAYEGNDPNIKKTFFTTDSGLAADCVILRHVLEHIPNPLAFLKTVADANGGNGDIYIEVPCFDWICRRRAWFDIFYEHVNYFRLSDFHRIFSTVVESGRIFNGQYLYVVARLSTLRTPCMEETDAIHFPEDFTASAPQNLPASVKGKRRAIWGGAAKGMTFAYFLQRAGVSVDMVIDINPAKQGKYLAGSGLRILSPNEAVKVLQPGDDVYVMNSNYLEEIIEITNNRFHYITVEEK